MSRPARLRVVLALNLALVGALIAVGLTAHSLGVLAEGVDYLADAAAVAVALVAIRLESRPRADGRQHRATTWAALINAGWLLVLSLAVIGGAADRLATGARQVHGLPVLVVSGVAAVVMLGGALVLGGDVDDLDDDDDDDDDGEALTMRAVLLDTAADAAAAAGVAVTGGVIYATGGWYWLDPLVALLVSAVVGYHAARLLRTIMARLSPAAER